MLIDDISITLAAGHGGAGKVSFGRKMKSGPDGGNGGKGGDIYISVTSDLFALNQFSKEKHIVGVDGLMGSSNNKSGKNGRDIELKLPLGSILTNLDSGQEVTLTDLNQKILICKGGIGGKGNFELRSSTNTTPMRAQKGLSGDSKQLRIVLKFIAKYGLIGLPNAGKSSILNELTNAHARTGDYPFTTLETNLGDLNGSIIADIPGLIEGASEGKGLGIKFLKHIEKVELLLHCISAESKDVETEYKVITNELGKYNELLLMKKRLILLTKTDLVDEKVIKKQTTKLKKFKHSIFPISIHDLDSIKLLQKKLK